MLRERDRFRSLEEKSDKELQITVSSSTLDFPQKSLSPIVTNPGGEAEVVPVVNMYYSPVTAGHY